MAHMFMGMAQLMAGMGDIVKDVKPGEPLPENRTLTGAAADVLSGFKDMKRSQRKALENNEIYVMAKAIFDKPLEHVDLKKMQEMVGKKDQLKADMEKSWKSAALISDDRAKEISQESMAFVWTQLFPMFGTLSTADAKADVPKVRIDTVEKQDPHPEQLPTFLCKGTVEGGGAFSITMNGYGAPKLEDLTLDLGKDRLGKLAANTVAHMATVRAGGGAVAAGSASLLNPQRKADEPYEFLVGLPAGKSAKLSMTPEGFPLYQTLDLG
ncbi:MAG TPA: hypothetical protein VGO62_01350, partial [Myxococcota bacterium]|jgi:hypothetical protein